MIFSRGEVRVLWVGKFFKLRVLENYFLRKCTQFEGLREFMFSKLCNDCLELMMHTQQPRIGTSSMVGLGMKSPTLRRRSLAGLAQRHRPRSGVQSLSP